MSTPHTVESGPFVLAVALHIFIIGLPILIVSGGAPDALSEFLRYGVEMVPIWLFVLLVLFVALFENLVFPLVIILILVFELGLHDSTQMEI